MRISLSIDIEFRRARAADLPLLEWDGLYAGHRAVIRRTFDRQLAGEAAMLVADVAGFPIGQAWLDFTAAADRHAVVIWAVRLAPGFRRLGIGSHLMSYVEQTIVASGRRVAELGVEKSNVDARRFYERLGYVLIGELCTETMFELPVRRRRAPRRRDERPRRQSCERTMAGE